MGMTYQSVIVDAPAERVWATVRDFHDMSWTPDVIESCRAVGDCRGDQPGAKRVLNEAFHETLQAIDELERTVRYSIDDGPSPVSRNEVSHYVGTLRVRPVTQNDTAFVEWSSQWYGKDQEAAEFCHNIYVALLTALRKHFA